MSAQRDLKQNLKHVCVSCSGPLTWRGSWGNDEELTIALEPCETCAAKDKKIVGLIAQIINLCDLR